MAAVMKKRGAAKEQARERARVASAAAGCFYDPAGVPNTTTKKQRLAWADAILNMTSARLACGEPDLHDWRRLVNRYAESVGRGTHPPRAIEMAKADRHAADIVLAALDGESPAAVADYWAEAEDATLAREVYDSLWAISDDQPCADDRQRAEWGIAETQRRVRVAQRRRLEALEESTEAVAPADGLRDKQTEARDKWVYAQCMKRIAYKAVIAQLTKKNWEPITSLQGVKACAIRYANRHKLPVPPRRTM